MELRCLHVRYFGTAVVLLEASVPLTSLAFVREYCSGTILSCKFSPNLGGSTEVCAGTFCKALVCQRLWTDQRHCVNALKRFEQIFGKHASAVLYRQYFVGVSVARSRASDDALTSLLRHVDVPIHDSYSASKHSNKRHCDEVNAHLMRVHSCHVFGTRCGL